MFYVKFTGAVFTFGKSKFAENAPSKFWIKKDEVLFEIWNSFNQKLNSNLQRSK